MKKHLDYILSNQSEDGWLGPRDPNGNFGKGKFGQLDPWPVFVFLKAVTQYAEAFPNDERIIPAMLKFMKMLKTHLDTKTLEPYVWAKFRWQDLVVSIHWLYDRTVGQDWLLELSATAHSQGYDWVPHFKDFKFKEKSKDKHCSLDCHGVNNAQGIKQGAVQFREQQTDEFKNNVQIALDNLDKYHGTPTGIFSADELLAGLNPAQGTELCAVVEYMYSLEVALNNVGNASWADRLESIAFNALPSTFDPAMMYHQYVQQPNQVVANKGKKLWWTNDGDASNLYGVAPNYGCCTANYHQGWPKFVSSLWMKRTSDQALVAVAYAPSTVSAYIQGATVNVELKTEYPFGNGTLEFVLTASNTAQFPLALRIPAWSSGVKIVILNDGSVHEPTVTGAFYSINRIWEKGVTYRIIMTIPLQARLTPQFEGSISVFRGPLLFGLKRDPIATKVENCKANECDDPFDYELTSETQWNYALKVDNLEKAIQFTLHPISNMPFSPTAEPVKATVQARQVPSWSLDIDYQAAITIPQSPVVSDEPLRNLTLVPFGSTNLRVSVFPYLKN
jgi:hypothetical protein